MKALTALVHAVSSAMPSVDEWRTIVRAAGPSTKRKRSEMKWIDVTSYSRGERGVVDPRAWQLDECSFRVVVYTSRQLPGLWFVTCHDLRIESAQLVVVGPDAAQEAGLAYVRSRLQAIQKAFDRVTALSSRKESDT